MFSKFKYFLRRNGINVQRRPFGAFKPIALFQKYDIDLLIDVGANSGQYAQTIRSLGYDGYIYSYEPLIEAFEKLKIVSDDDFKWKSFNVALGNFDGKAEINVALNSQSSSLLNMLPSHIKSAPESIYTRKELINVRKLDTIFEQGTFDKGENLFLKVDTQGFEKKVLEGGMNSINRKKVYN